MGNKKSTKNVKEIKIPTDKPTNTEYTFFYDNGLAKLGPTSNPDDDLSKESKKGDNYNIAYSLRRYSDKLKRTDNLRFKSSKITKAQSKQNHSPVYE
jgi:hypothetical protein